MLIFRRFGSFFGSLKRVHADIFMLACALSAKQRTNPPKYDHVICIGKTKCTSEKGLLRETLTETAGQLRSLMSKNI